MSALTIILVLQLASLALLALWVIPPALRRARRDYFAAMAMQAMTCGHFTHHGHSEYWPPKDIAEEAYDRADAMLAARKEGGAA